MADLNQISGYYNLYDSSKGYTELLFRAGKVLQSKEVNEIQSVLKNQIKNVGDTILTNGDIIEGCQLVINLEEGSVTVTKGRIYLDGNVHLIDDTVIPIEGVGTEVIGAVLRREVVTPDEDKDLLDVSSGYDNYNQDGAYRLKEYVEITINDSQSSILYTLQDGQQLTVSTSEDLTQLDKMNSTLARRTFDESGNYKVNGLKLVNKNFSDENKIFVSMESGKAYVKGFEVNKVSATTVGLNRPNTMKTIDNEPKIYRNETSLYELNNDYVSDIRKLVAIVQANQNITRGSIIGGIDYLPLSPVVEVVSIVQGDTTYILNTDFRLVDDGIDWSIGTSVPSPGTSYEVTWNYNKNLVKNTDYVMEYDQKSNSGYAKFLEGGDKPVDGSTFLVNYDFSLCRRDVISLDKDGNVIVTEGQPDVLRTVESPSVDTSAVLVLGSVLLKPNTNDIAIINNNTQTIPMIDLYKMLERINALEYNQSISDLDKEAADGENATELMGVFTDGFIGLSKSDIYHEEWTASIDLDNQELTIPFETNVANLVVNESENYNVGVFNKIMTASYREVQLLSQPLATGSLRVNSYNAFPKTPSVKLQPEVDNWIDEKEVVVQGATKTTYVTLRRWWYHKNASWAEQEKALWQSYGLEDGGESLGWNSGTSVNKSVTSSILDETIMYMRQNNVKVTIQNLEPLVDNITATFDGVNIKLTAEQNEYRGNNYGTLKADARGVSKGYFTIPANTLCGTREVKIYPESSPYLVGSANYTANGRKITTTKKVWTEIIAMKPTDPLAQSFQFDVDQYLTGVGIYFLEKDSEEPITIQVRNMVNGYPGTTCYAEKVVYGSEIKTSASAEVETKILFDDPVYCNAGEQYCFTILSNSDVDAVWIAETTKTDILTGQQISKNPYLNGTLFSSSNALTWTAHQSSDMKFNLYGATFSSKGSATFYKVSDLMIDRLMVVSEETIPTGCSISWQYAINGGAFNPIETYSDRELSEVAEDVTVKVEITANSYTSPAIALDSLILCTFANENKGVYVSKNVHMDAGFNNIKQVVDLHIPANTNVNMYYATDVDGEVWHPLNNTNTVQKSIDYKTFTFEASLGETAHDYRCKLELTTVEQTYRPRAKNLRSIMKMV